MPRLETTRTPALSGLLIAFLSAQAGAQGSTTPWLSHLPPTPRSAGLGGVSTALWGDAGTVFVNASGVAIVRHAAVEGSFSRLPNPVEHWAMAGAVRIRQFNLAAGYQRLELPPGSAQESSSMLAGSLVYRFGLFALSGGVRHFSVSDSAGVTSTATAGDASVIIAIFDIAAVSASFQNIGQPVMDNGMVLPATTRLGASLNLVDPQGTGRLLGTLEVVWTEGSESRSIIGGEAGLVFDGFGAVLRAGYSGLGPLTGQSRWTLGGSLVLGPVDIDYSWQEQSVFGDDAHRLGLRLTL